MKNENMKKNNKGFSLVELIVVIAIMAVLMVILAPAMLRYVEKTRVQKDESAISEVANAAELALGDEEIYTEANNVSPIYVKVANNATIEAHASTTTGTRLTKLETDIQKTVGTSIKFASKEYSTKTVYAVLEFDNTKQAYVIVKFGTAQKPFSTTM